MGYKLVAVDLDGTLLNEEKKISKENLKYIKLAIEKGVKFVLCSGRIPYALRSFKEIIPGNEALICCNGGEIINEEGQCIYKNMLSQEEASKAIEILRERATSYHFYFEDALCTENVERAMNFQKFFNAKIVKSLQMEIRILPDAIKFINEKTEGTDKIVVIDGDYAYLEELRERIERELGLEVTKSDKNNIEIMKKGINKGAGLKILADYYNIPLEECIAIGNDENDITMIEAAGLGVAMENAHNKIKERANYVTENDNDHDGIAEVLKKYVLV